MSDATESALTSMLRLKREIEERLAANQDYRALMAITKAIDEVRGPMGASVTLSKPPLGSALRGQPERHRNLSQSEAVERVLSEHGVPMSTNEMLPLVQQLGAATGGKDPAINLSSTLSRDKKFQSVRWHERRAWWFSDRPLPNESSGPQSADTETAGSASQTAPAASQTYKGGTNGTALA